MTKTIFITGASTGFGRIAADLLHNKGFQVYGTSRYPEKYETDFSLIELDVTSKPSVEKAVALVMQKAGNIDVLINNAGRAIFGTIEESSEDNIQDIFETNVFGLMRTTAAVLPIMRQQRSGRIINVSSLAGLVPTPSLGVYCSTKHAVEGYTKSLRYEVEQFGIEVMLVKPGEYMTQVFDNSIKTSLQIEDYDKFRKLIQSQMEVRTPENLPPPTEVGQLIVDLVDKSNPAFDNLIGPFADAIPQLLAMPAQLDATIREVYQVDQLNANN